MENSRPIEFRAWHKYDKHYRTWKQLTSFRYNERWFIDNTDKEYLNWIFSDDEFILEQYTGLKSNNNTGTKIFEGDKVYIAGYGEYTAEFPFLELYDAMMESDIGEIIGNIHEDKKLTQEEV